MKRFDVTGMSCAACSAHVEKAVRAVSGVTEVAVSLLTNSMTVEFDPPATPEAICDAVKRAGYGAVPAGEKTSLSAPGTSGQELDRAASKKRADGRFDAETGTLIRRLALSTILLIILMIWKNGTAQMLLALAVLLLNRRFFVSGFRGLVHGAPNMDTLVALGSGVSFVYSVFLLAAGKSGLYFESAAMILVLITVGKLLEAYSKGKTTSAIDSLLRLAPAEVRVLREGEEVLIPAEELAVGDTFIVKPGEAIPADGVVTEGESTVDESALTGESVPVAKYSGDTVSTPTINQRGILVCRATATGGDTTLSRIVRMVEDAAASKAPSQKLADKVAGVFVPVVMGIAAVTFAVWMIVLGQNPALSGGEAPLSFALTRAISVLVISCPCSLGLATPVAIMAGSGVGARSGILFKTAAALENAGKVETVVLDKTGTITVGTVRDENNLTEDAFREVRDRVRPDSRAAIEELHALGLRVKMLTGDKKETALRIASEVGIPPEDIIAEVLPDGKDQAIRDVQTGGGTDAPVRTAMVGDGINDGPALKRADVGIAIGAGTDVAIDAADIVLMKSTLSDAAAAIRLSRKTLKNIKENLFWAFCYNAICIPIAAGVLWPRFGIALSPMLGAACMSLSSVCVVSNALRLNLFKPSNNMNQIAQAAQEEQNMTKELNVEGMMCMHCVAHVEAALKAVPGVLDAKADLKGGSATVTLAEDVADSVLEEAVKAAGYGAAVR